MRKLLDIMLIFSMGLVLASLSGCSDDDPVPAGDAAIKVATDEVTPNSIKVTFTPNDNTVGYSFSIGSSDQLAAFEGGTLPGIENVTSKGETTKTFENLTPDTEYTIFARGVNSDGATGKTTTLSVSTKEEEMVGPATVAITVDEEKDFTVTVTFTPNEYAVSYKIGIGDADDQDKFEDGTLPEIQTVNERDAYQKIFENLSPLTEYTIFAIAVNADDEKSEVYTKTVSTTKEQLMLTIESALAEYWGNVGWADNTDITLFSGSAENGYFLFFESFAPESDEPAVVPGTYNVSFEIPPDEFEFAAGMDDGTGNIRQSQLNRIVDGERTKYAIIEGYYIIEEHSNGTHTITVDVETEEYMIKCTYTGEIEIDDEPWW